MAELYEMQFSMTHHIPAGGGVSRHPDMGDLDSPIDGWYLYVDISSLAPVFADSDQDANALGEAGIKLQPGEWRSLPFRVRKFMSFASTDFAVINHVGWRRCIA